MSPVIVFLLFFGMPRKAVLVLGLRWWILHRDRASEPWRKSSAYANKDYEEEST